MGEILASELSGGEIICLSGELGAGKTTFTQGLLSGLGVEGPYTSPTFIVLRHYEVKSYKVPKVESKIRNVYHIDTYRVNSQDIIDLGWEEIVSNDENVTVVEWADRIRGIIPEEVVWVSFEWVDEDKRKIKIQNAKIKSASQNSKVSS